MKKTPDERCRAIANPLRIALLSTAATLILSLLFVLPAAAQTPAGSAILGSVPSGPPDGAIVKLTLHDAISMALRYNLGQIESNENVRTTRGQRLQALSLLLPHISAGVSENVVESSLSTIGLKVPGIPRVIGPFSFSTAEASASQSLFDFASIQRFRAARTAEQAAQMSYNDTLDVITLVVGNSYLRVIEATSRIKAAEAQVQNAQAVYNQAGEDLHAGTSPKIDVTRSEVQLHTEQYNLSVARNDFAIAKLNLARAIGLPLGQQFEIAETIPYADIEPPNLKHALNTAFHTRSDFLAARESVMAARRELSAIQGERYPVVAVNGGYGVQGPVFGHSHGVFGFSAGVRIPIFTGGQIRGEETTAEATLQKRKAEAENLRGQIDYDVRTAYLNVQAAKEQVAVAKQNVDLANENLDRSKERFSAGVTDSVEVVQAEQSLASANDQYIVGLYAHNLAKLELARALGVARTNYSQYLSAH